MIRYLPAKSHVVIQDSAGKLRWYDTRLVIELTDEPTVVQCPIRHQPVQMITFAGFGIFFMADQAKWRASEEEVKKIGQMELYRLEYDIPQNAQMYDDETHPFNHPSEYLWSLGIRSSKSCWVLPRSRQRINKNYRIC